VVLANWSDSCHCARLVRSSERGQRSRVLAVRRPWRTSVSSSHSHDGHGCISGQPHGVVWGKRRAVVKSIAQAMALAHPARRRDEGKQASEAEGTDGRAPQTW
jgi:hypothetical protein